MHMVHDQEQGEIDQQGPEKANGDQLQVTSWLVFSGSALLGHSLKGPGFSSRQLYQLGEVIFLKLCVFTKSS